MARLGLHRQQAFALQLLARELARPADRLGLFARALLGGLLVMAAQFHFAENALALHLLLERLEGLIDIVVANENLHGRSCFLRRPRPGMGTAANGQRKPRALPERPRGLEARE
jgi:hypothetical protein